MAKKRRKSSKWQFPWEKLFGNRYFLVFIGFAVWMAFFDRNDFSSQAQLRQQLNGLEEDKAYFERRIAEIKEAKETVEADREKYAREEYFLTNHNEDVFIFVEE